MRKDGVFNEMKNVGNNKKNAFQKITYFMHTKNSRLLLLLIK